MQDSQQWHQLMDTWMSASGGGGGRARYSPPNSNLLSVLVDVHYQCDEDSVVVSLQNSVVNPGKGEGVSFTLSVNGTKTFFHQHQTGVRDDFQDAVVTVRRSDFAHDSNTYTGNATLVVTDTQTGHTVTNSFVLDFQGNCQVRPPVADFVPGNVTRNGVPTTETKFQDSSTAGDAPLSHYLWDFGDGNTSEEKEPIHTYAESDVYFVTLVVTDELGNTDSAVRNTTIPVQERFVLPPDVGFAPVKPECFAMGPLQVNNLSQDAGLPVQWHWDFGDGTTSSLRNPAPHQYPNPGQYTVTLSATNPDTGVSSQVSETVDIEACLVPVPAFSAEIPSCVDAGPIQVTNLSLDTGNNLQFLWDFGDGNTSLLENPEDHAYQSPGQYTVSLTATDADTGLAETVTQQINVEPCPLPQTEIAVQANPCLVASYENLTPVDGQAILWHWDLGDGNSSSLRNPPNHVYPGPGTYTVELTATNSATGASSSDSAQVVLKQCPQLRAIPHWTGPARTAFRFLPTGVPGQYRFYWDFSFAFVDPVYAKTAAKAVFRSLEFNNPVFAIPLKVGTGHKWPLAGHSEPFTVTQRETDKPTVRVTCDCTGEIIIESRSGLHRWIDP